jgi:hypothetical protein
MVQGDRLRYQRGLEDRAEARSHQGNRTMRRALIAFLCLTASARAGHTYDILPSPAASPSGLLFSPAGGDLVMTDVLVSGPAPAYLDLGVAFDHLLPGGGIAYRPAGDRLQLFLLSARLPGTVSSVVEHGLFLGDARALPVGPGRWEFDASLAMVGMTPDVFDLPGSVRVTFDLDRPLGHQVEGGVLVVGSVPEPSTRVLLLAGLGLGLVGLLLNRKGA